MEKVCGTRPQYNESLAIARAADSNGFGFIRTMEAMVRNQGGQSYVDGHEMRGKKNKVTDNHRQVEPKLE